MNAGVLETEIFGSEYREKLIFEKEWASEFHYPEETLPYLCAYYQSTQINCSVLVYR